MKIETAFDFRYLIPATLIIFFIFLFSPSGLIELVNKGKDLGIIIEVLILGMILPVGFLISSLTKLIMKCFHKKIYDENKVEKIFPDWAVSSKKELSFQELASWMISDTIDKENNGGQVRDQINKRWHMAMANFNSSIGILIALIVTSTPYYRNIIENNFNDCWVVAYWMISIFFICITIFHGKETLNSVIQMDRMLAEKIFFDKSKS